MLIYISKLRFLDRFRLATAPSVTFLHGLLMRLLALCLCTLLAWPAGAIERVYDENGKKKKVQGTVRGILKTVGFTEDMVYKY